MFENIQRVGFLPRGQIYSFFSFEGEELLTRAKINLNPSVELFMLDIQKEIKATLKEMLKVSYKNINIDSLAVADLFEYNNQILIVCLLTKYTRQIEKILSAKSESRAEKFEKFKSTINKNIEFSSKLIRKKIADLQRTSLEAILQISQQYKDICYELEQTPNLDAKSFEWTKQVRYTMCDTDETIVMNTLLVNIP